LADTEIATLVHKETLNNIDIACIVPDESDVPDYERSAEGQMVGLERRRSMHRNALSQSCGFLEKYQSVFSFYYYNLLSLNKN
jgi:hypothetical protein